MGELVRYNLMDLGGGFVGHELNARDIVNSDPFFLPVFVSANARANTNIRGMITTQPSGGEQLYRFLYVPCDSIQRRRPITFLKGCSCLYKPKNRYCKTNQSARKRESWNIISIAFDGDHRFA